MQVKNGKLCTGGLSDCASKYCLNNKCTASSCIDGVKNSDETDVDCGGRICPRCETGKACKSNADCFSNSCKSNKCVAPAKSRF